MHSKQNFQTRYCSTVTDKESYLLLSNEASQKHFSGWNQDQWRSDGKFVKREGERDGLELSAAPSVLLGSMEV